MKENFDLTDNGDLEWYLGFHVKRDRKNKITSLTQTQHITNLLKKFGMNEAKPEATPMPPKTKLRARKDKCQDSKLIKKYQQLVGGLIYLTTTLRVDLTHAVNDLARHMSNPTQEHFDAGLRVLRYLAGTRDMGLTFDGRSGDDHDPLLLHGFVDADYAEDKDTRASTIGFAFMLGGAAVSWKSKLLKVICTSSSESEYTGQSLHLLVCGARTRRQGEERGAS